MEASLNESHTLTVLLRRFSGGDRTVEDTMLRRVLPQLHRVAIGILSRKFRPSGLMPAELINEAWAGNLHRGGWKIESRQHFYAIAALAMRNVMVNFARARMAQRRGEGCEPVPIDDDMSVAAPGNLEAVILAGLAMDQLEKHNSASARVVDLHYFAGFTLEDIAAITGLSFSEVRRRWEHGRDWLKGALASSQQARAATKHH